MSRPIICLLFAVTASPPIFGQTANGWRGNGTGLWPDATPPLHWLRTPRGIAADLLTSAAPPTGKTPGKDAVPLAKGIIRDWQVLGPIAVKDSVQDFLKEQIPNEAELHPGAAKVGDLAWKPMAAKLDDRWAFGPAVPPTTNVGTALGDYLPNQVAFAHAYLYSQKTGTVRCVVDHTFGLKVWINGKEVYNGSLRQVALGSYYPMSHTEFCTSEVGKSPSFDLPLKAGWNRLLLKLSTVNRHVEGWNQQTFCMRLMDVPGIDYDNRNILWMTELPQRSNAAPIVVGNRIFVMAEPDELICLDKRSGKILWKAANSYYELLTPAERAANSAFGDKIEPLLASIGKERDFAKRLDLRTKMQKTLVKIDQEKFAWQADGHFQSHFGIVGFTSPAPVSDGKHVWVWCGNAIGACYDLDGKRLWMRRVPTSQLSYPSSPALADGVLAVYLGKLIGLDAKTGQVRWEQKKIDMNMGAILAGDVAGVPVFVTSLGHVVRASDGKMLYREKERAGGASSWAPPVILGNVVYLPRYGIRQLLVLDFADVKGEEWEPKRLSISVPDNVGLKPDGSRVDRPTCGSPLVVGDMVYMVDVYSTFYAFDLKAKKLAYHHDTELHGIFHYNAVPVAASPTLIGKHIVIQDNQGLALIVEPGREYRQVAKNRLGTQIERWWPLPAQESVGYAPPVPDGDRLYVRGERFLYCIGEK